jgi:hypothetical protein
MTAFDEDRNNTFLQQQGLDPEAPLEKFPAFPEEAMKRMTKAEREAIQKWNDDINNYFRRAKTRTSSLA